uniref:Amine oxidase domain-containing protein n=1 Tax=Meloidogyne incognita TaxID=6306 RepID=A0A914N5A4_MELIC
MSLIENKKVENVNNYLNEEIKIIILGAGPTALGALNRIFKLKKENLINENINVCVIEQEEEIGGLARSVIDVNGFCWDLGVHVMGISKYKNFVEAMEECVTEWEIIPRCAMAEMSHVIIENKKEEEENLNKINYYIPYPVQNSIPYFPKNLKLKCLEELNFKEEKEEENNLLTTKISEKEENFDSFSLSLFGETLQKIFVRPYNEKVWTVPISQMGTSWLQGRVPLIDLSQLKRRCSLSHQKLLIEDEKRQTAFRYPANCRGIGEMWKRFSERFPSKIFNFGQKVVEINSKTKNIFCLDKNGNKKKFNYNLLISTIPLTELEKMIGINNLSKPLKHSTVILVGIGLFGGKNDFVKKLSWAYYPRKEILFYRCTIISNFSSELIPKCSSSSSSSSDLIENKNNNQFWSILCEIGQSSDKELPLEKEQKNKIFDKIILDLISVGIINKKENICSKWIKCLPFGYPIPTKERDFVLKECHKYLEKLQIYSRGRFGGWKYELSNQDVCFQIGIELIDKIFLNIPETLYV